MTQKENNMELWLKVCETDPKSTKTVKTRGGFTAVCAQAQVKRATELWGPYGRGWGLKDCKYSILQHDGKFILVLDAVFAYPGAEFQISVDMPFLPGNDCYKKLRTSAQSKSLALLGFNADIFMGLFDDCAYVEDMRAKHDNGQDLRNRAIAAIRQSTTAEQLEKCTARVAALRSSDGITLSIYSELMQILEQQEASLVALDNSQTPITEEEAAEIRRQEALA